MRLGLLLLIAAGKLIVTGAETIAAAYGVSQFVIGATVVAVGTSVPELATAVVAKLKGHDEVRWGTVLGSNIFNGLFIVGLVAVIHPIEVSWQTVMVALVVGLIALICSFPSGSGLIERRRGFLLIALYCVYVATVLQGGEVAVLQTGLTAYREPARSEFTLGIRGITLRLMRIRPASGGRCKQPGGSPLGNYIRFHDFPMAGIDPMTAATARSFPRHMHDQYGIGVVDSGGHSSWSDRGQVEAGPGDFICVNPGEVHDGRAIGHQVRSWRILYFDPALMEQAGTDILEGAHGLFMFAAPVFADGSMHRLFDAAFAYTAAIAGPSEMMASETAILSLVARLIGAHRTSAARRDPEPTACIRRARSRIDDDPAAAVTLVELAKEVGLSRYQLIRGFAHELGLTPHAYILQQRIALARRLIRGGCALAEAAATAGFYDQSHLTRCFVRQFGVTPSRYASNAE